jgi:hypothetical protein
MACFRVREIKEYESELKPIAVTFGVPGICIAGEFGSTISTEVLELQVP